MCCEREEKENIKLSQPDTDAAEVRNASRSLVQAVRLLRRGELKQPDGALRDPRQK